MPDRKLIDECVHCGFCLPACPTYQTWGQEMDSPRGRIYLMKAHNEGRLPLSGTIVEHFDRCLGCLACVSACPSGVQYDVLIEQTRAEIERVHRRSLWDRLFRALLFALFPYPARLRWLGLLQLVRQPVQEGQARLGPSSPRTLGHSRPHSAGSAAAIPCRARARSLR